MRATNTRHSIAAVVARFICADNIMMMKEESKTKRKKIKIQ